VSKSLASLDAEFIVATGNGTWFHTREREHGASGLLLDCPCGAGHKLAVWFSNPLAPAPAAHETEHPLARWQRTGETLDTLTIHPSVNAPCWHGWIQNGQATSC